MSARLPAGRARWCSDRCGRQGAPGSYEQLVSLEDRLLETHVADWLRSALREGWPSRLAESLLTKMAQRAEERRSALARRRLMASERVLEDLLAFAGRR